MSGVAFFIVLCVCIARDDDDDDGGVNNSDDGDADYVDIFLIYFISFFFGVWFFFCVLQPRECKLTIYRNYSARLVQTILSTFFASSSYIVVVDKVNDKDRFDDDKGCDGVDDDDDDVVVGGDDCHGNVVNHDYDGGSDGYDDDDQMLNACDIVDENIFACDFYRFPFYSMIMVAMMMMIMMMIIRC